MHDVELDRLADQPAQQHLQFRQHVVELQRLRAQRLAAREGEQLAHEARRAIGVLLDLHDVLEGRIGRPVIGEQQIGIADDRGQHVVEVMRDAAGELADRLHLLALREILLQRALLGRVEREDGGARALVAAADRRPRRRSAPSARAGAFQRRRRAGAISPSPLAGRGDRMRARPARSRSATRSKIDGRPFGDRSCDAAWREARKGGVGAQHRRLRRRPPRSPSASN